MALNPLSLEEFGSAVEPVHQQLIPVPGSWNKAFPSVWNGPKSVGAGALPATPRAGSTIWPAGVERAGFTPTWPVGPPGGLFFSLTGDAGASIVYMLTNSPRLRALLAAHIIQPRVSLVGFHHTPCSLVYPRIGPSGRPRLLCPHGPRKEVTRE